jgi:hypothetical protein
VIEYRVISTNASDDGLAEIMNHQDSDGFSLWEFIPRGEVVTMVFTRSTEIAEAKEGFLAAQSSGQQPIMLHEPYSPARMKAVGNEVLFSLYVEEDELVRKGSAVDVMTAIENRMLAQVAQQIQRSRPPDIGPFIIEIWPEGTKRPVR